MAVRVRVMGRRGYNYRVSDGRSWTTVPRRVATWPMASARTTAAWVGEGSEFRLGVGLGLGSGFGFGLGLGSEFGFGSRSRLGFRFGFGLGLGLGL